MREEGAEVEAEDPEVRREEKVVDMAGGGDADAGDGDE